jgi:hypothetical protein
MELNTVLLASIFKNLAFEMYGALSPITYLSMKDSKVISLLPIVKHIPFGISTTIQRYNAKIQHHSHITPE